MSAKALESECENFGRVLSCKLKYDSDGVPIGYGYVQFEDKADAVKCIDGLNGKILNDKAISVSVFVQRSKRAANLNPNKNLFIRNFPADWDEVKINDFIGETFKRFGETQSIGICKDKSRGLYYAFVAYYNEDEARAAYDEMNDEQIPGYEEKLYVNFAKSKRQFKMEQLQKFIQQPTNLYIKWLRTNITGDEIQRAFESFGTVTSVCLKQNTTRTMASSLPQNYNLNFAFVNFAIAEEAKFALTNGKNNELIKSLLDIEWHKTKQEFLYYAQNKTHRLSYLKAKRKKKNQMSSFGHMASLMDQLQSNPTIHKQLMKVLQSQGISLPDGTKGPMGGLPGVGGFGNDFRGNQFGGQGNTQMPNQPFSTKPPKPAWNDYNKDKNSKYGPSSGSYDNRSKRGGGMMGNNSMTNPNNMMNSFGKGNMNMNMMNMNPNFTNMNNPMGAQGMPSNLYNMMNQNNSSNPSQQRNMNNYFGGSQNAQMNKFTGKPGSESQQTPNMSNMYPGGQQPVNPVHRDYEWLKSNEEEFMSLSQQDQKVILGNTLYPKIKGKHLLFFLINFYQL